MGRLHSINGEAATGSTRENLIDSFGYMPSIGAHSALSPGRSDRERKQRRGAERRMRVRSAGNGDKYIDPGRKIPGRWQGCQIKVESGRTGVQCVPPRRSSSKHPEC